MKPTQFEFNLPYFPKPLESETAYSVLCRFGRRFGKNALKLLKRLTGRNFCYSFFGGFPSQLSILSNFLPYGHPWKNVESLLFLNTILPYYVYFYPANINRNWYLKMTGSNGTILPLRGIIQGRIIPRNPRFCPKCVQDQINNHGFTYFIKEHQLPGVLRCYIHHSLLSFGCSVCGPYPIKGIPFCLPGECYCEGNLSPLYIHFDESIKPEASIWIAEQSAYIVNSKGTNSKDIRLDLRRALEMKGAVNGKLINHQKISAAIEEKFGVNFLNLIGYPARQNQVSHPWIKRLLSVTPSFTRKLSLKYLLLIGTFFDSVQTFEKIIYQNYDSPFNFNSRENILDINVINKKDNMPIQIQERLETLSTEPNVSIIKVASVVGATLDRVATFYIMRNIRIPLSPKAKFRIGEGKLKEIKNDLNSGILKKDIYSKHSISEWTLKLILMDEPGLYQRNMNMIREKIKNIHRQKLNEYLYNNPKTGRLQIQKYLNSTYEYLSANDGEWFHNRLPMKQRMTKTQRKTKIDWISEDQQRANELIVFFNKVKSSNDKPFWITKSISLKNIGCDYTKFLANSNKYQKTKEILEKHVETREANIKRRIIWALNKLKEDGKSLTLIRLRLKSGLTEVDIKKYARFVISQAEVIRLKTSPLSFFNGYSDEAS